VATPVHPDGGVVGSTRAARSLTELPEPPELAVVAVPAAEVRAVARDAAQAGVRALLVVSTGFGDTDEPDGQEREEALLSEVRSHGLRLVGPNALGVLNTDPAVGLRALIGDVEVREGGLGLSSQSGALGLALLGHAAARGMGVSSFLALGNRADVSTNDVLDHFADDDRTRVVAFYVESFGNPRRFSEVARRVSRRKPILAVKGGRRPDETTADANAMRIAAALTDAEATQALFHQAGVLRVESTQTLFDAAELLEHQPLPEGRRLGVVTNSGGLGTVVADAAAARGLRLATPSQATRTWLATALPAADRVSNPVDLGVRATTGDEREAVLALLADDAVDALVVVHFGLGDEDPAMRLRALEHAVEGAAKPVVACVVGRNGAMPARATREVPNFRFPEAAVRALSVAADRRDWLARRRGQSPRLEGFDADAARAVAARMEMGMLDPEDAAALLATAGVHVGAKRMGNAGVDVLVGAVNDPELGPVVGVGAGDRPALVAGDVAFRLAPLTDIDAEELVDAPPAVRAALAGAELDVASLRDLVLRVAALADAVPELAEAELDPVRVQQERIAVLGARVRLAAPAERARPKTW
jgi:acyl-CoA synthetase (NDP forming)